MDTARSTPSRVLVVTGASSGIGREVARLAARQGFAVFAVARRAERLNELAGEVRSSGGTIETLACDITARDAPARIVQGALHAFARIDVLIHNAGAAAPGDLLAQSGEAIEAQWQTHVAAPLRITREAFPALRASRGQVMLLGSGLARVPSPGFGAYCAAKAAARAAAAQLRRELRADGVAVTYVDPGAVDTEFSQASGMVRSRGALLVSPQHVAAKILAATRTRPARLNAVWWQSLGVAIAELVPFVADRAITRFAGQPATQERSAATPQCHPERSDAQHRAVEDPALSPSKRRPSEDEGIEHSEGTSNPTHAADDFSRALEPAARRMERVNLSADFLRAQLVIGSELHLNDLAMQWVGMPNKNERAALAEALQALEASGFLQATGPESWRVLRAASA